uniref:hypothetical protein n=1 Tax=uncultured Desulfovibrio sp. TaxID=167968 RepID=UPI00265D1461
TERKTTENRSAAGGAVARRGRRASTGPVSAPSGRPALPIPIGPGRTVEDARMTSINILIGTHLTMILCLLPQPGD